VTFQATQSPRVGQYLFGVLAICTLGFAGAYLIACDSILSTWSDATEAGRGIEVDVPKLSLTFAFYILTIASNLLTNATFLTVRGLSRSVFEPELWNRNWRGILLASVWFPLLLLAQFLGGFAIFPAIAFLLGNMHFYRRRKVD
jgi:hypothetical protein